MDSDRSFQSMRFFVLDKRREGAHGSDFIRLGSNLGPAARCPQCGEAIGTLSWSPPYQGGLELYGDDFGDLIKGPCGGLLLSERFAEDFRTEGLTGFNGFHPVEVMRVRRKRGGPKPGSPPHYLFVTPSYGYPALDMERSHIRSQKPMECTCCRYVGADAIHGLTLEAGTWKGEDVFRPRGLWGVIIVSERFKNLVERHAKSNAALVPIEEYVWESRMR